MAGKPDFLVYVEPMCGPSRSKLEIGQRQLGDVKVLPKVESFLAKSLVNGFGSYGESDVTVQDISGPFSSSNRPWQLLYQRVWYQP